MGKVTATESVRVQSNVMMEWSRRGEKMGNGMGNRLVVDSRWGKGILVVNDQQQTRGGRGRKEGDAMMAHPATSSGSSRSPHLSASVSVHAVRSKRWTNRRGTDVRERTTTVRLIGVGSLLVTDDEGQTKEEEKTKTKDEGRTKTEQQAITTQHANARRRAHTHASHGTKEK